MQAPWSAQLGLKARVPETGARRTFVFYQTVRSAVKHSLGRGVVRDSSSYSGASRR